MDCLMSQDLQFYGNGLFNVCPKFYNFMVMDCLMSQDLQFYGNRLFNVPLFTISQ